MHSYNLALARLPILFVCIAPTVEAINASSNVSGPGRQLQVATRTTAPTSSTHLSMASSSTAVKVNRSSNAQPSRTSATTTTMLHLHLLRKVPSTSGTRTRSRGSNDCECNSLESAPSTLPTVDHAIPANLPVGGRLRYFWRTWQTFGASHRVVRWLRFGYPLPFYKDHRGLPLTPPLSVQPPPEIVTSYADPVKQALLNDQLDQLVAKQAIREIPHTDYVHFSRVFLVPKKNGKMRMVADLSRLNHWLQCPSFKMDNAQVVRDALLPDLWATSIDLTDAYLHIPIHPACQKFLVFQVGNRRFMWLVLPFGLNTAPRVFSDVMKVLKQWGRTVGIFLF